MAGAGRLSPIRVTRMEMTAPPAGPALKPPREDAVIAEARLAVEDYLVLYSAVGESLRWDRRLLMPREVLAAYLAGPLPLILRLTVGGFARGFIEFELGGGDVELKHFGVVPEAQGQGLGPWLLDAGLHAAWARGIGRIRLHTDDWDHPKARAIYLRAGFRIYADGLEDPTDL